MRNLEFKARIDDSGGLLRRARELGADLWGDLRQTDTYFRVSQGRLKLRETAGRQAELIYYERDEEAQGRPSDYETALSPDGVALKLVLSNALEVLGVVRKRRTLLLLDAVRVHLDNVDGLGLFLELEVPVKDGEAAARERLNLLLRQLGFDEADGVRASYLDLMLAKARASTGEQVE